MNSSARNLSFGVGFFARANVRSQELVVACTTLAMTIYAYFLATGRTWDPTFANAVKGNNPFSVDFFRNQALALLDGRLDVPSEGYRWTECMVNDGKCFGYFGLFPSLLRFPEFIITGDTSVNHIPVYVALGVGLCFWASIDFLRRVITDTASHDNASDAIANRVLMLGVLIIGPASILTFLSEPAVYEEAVVWSIAMTMVTVNMVWRWVHGRQIAHLLIAVAAGVAATNSRPSSVPIIAGLGSYLVYRSFSKSSRRVEPRARLLEVALLVVPALTYAGVMNGKFGQVTPPLEKLNYSNDLTFRELVRSNNGHLTGPRFMVTNIFQYLRPDSISLSSTYPWFRPTVTRSSDAFVVPPVTRTGVWTDGVVSATNTMFVQLALSVTFVTASIGRIVRRRHLDVASALVLSAGLGVAPALLNYAFLTRYVGDFYPFLIVGSVFGLASLMSSEQVGPVIKRISLDVAMSLALLSTLVWYVLRVNRW